MPAKIKHEWSVLLDIVRRLWSALGSAPTPHAVSKEAGGGATSRIQQAITAVGIEHGLYASLYAELPDDLRRLIQVPADRPDALPEVEGSPALASAVRDALAQIASACGAAERNVRRDAERFVAEAETRMAAERAAMSRRLQASAAEADAEALAHAEFAAELQWRLGTMGTDLATARAEREGYQRELIEVRSALHNAQVTEFETRGQWEQRLEQQRAESATYAASLAAVTERALRAEAERDAVREHADRLATESDGLRRAMAEAAARSESEIAGLHAEVAAARQAHQDADRLRAVAEALLAESRTARAAAGNDRAERHA